MEELFRYALKDVIIDHLSGFELWCLKLSCKLCYVGIPFMNVKQCLKRDIYNKIKTRYPRTFKTLPYMLDQGIIKISGSLLRSCFTCNWKSDDSLNVYVNKKNIHDNCGKKLCICSLLCVTFASVYKMENDSLQHVSILTEPFGAIMDQDLRVKSFDYFCNGVATIRSRSYDKISEFGCTNVIRYDTNNILMNIIIDDMWFGFNLVVSPSQKASAF